MQLTIGGIITFMALLAGLNFFGLFLVVWLMDRTARHLALYVGCTVFFGFSAMFDIVVLTGGLPPGAHILSRVMDTAAMVLVIRGMSMDFGLRIPDRHIYIVAGLGVIAGLTQSVFQPPEEVLRLSGIIVSHGVLMLLLVRAAFIHRPSQRIVRILGVFALTFAMNYLAFHPLIASQVSSLAKLTELQRLDVYISVTNTVFIVLALAFSAVLFFHTMNRLVIAYRNASLTDPLTGLWNRRGFFAALSSAAVQPACIIMADIDHFKQINDRFGHDAGDRTIIAVASILKESALQTTVCGRLGGEEFGIFLPNTPLAAGHAFANALRMGIEAFNHDALPQGYLVTASFGVCEIANGDTKDGLRRADASLYKAKNGGRNRVSSDVDLPGILKEAA